MPVPLTAQKLVEQVRIRVADKDSQIWTDTEILDAADVAMGHVTDTVRLQGQDHELDRLSIAAASWTKIEDHWYEYDLPEWVGSVRRLEGVTGTSDVRPLEIAETQLEKRDIARAPFATAQPRYHLGKLGRPGTLSFIGDIGSFTSIRVWFIRRFPSLHWGTAGTPASPTTELRFAAAPTSGVVIKRASLYIGLDVQFTSGALIDVIRRITAWDGTDATLSSALPAASTGLNYSLIVPLECEHGGYFIEEVAREMLARLANTEAMAGREAIYKEREERFVAGIGQRDNDRPKRLWSRRR